MRCFKQAAVVIIVLVIGHGFTTSAEQGLFRVSDRQVTQLLEILEAHTDSFHRSLDEAIAHSFLNDAELGNYIKHFTWEFDRLTNQLKERSRDHKPISSLVQEVLNRGAYLNTFMQSYDLAPQAERDWELVSADLDQLSHYYKIKTRWGLPVSLGASSAVDPEPLANRLTGTYELNESESDNVREMVDRVVHNLPVTARRRVLTTLVQRLRSPEKMALERRGDQVTLASSISSVRTYVADGHALIGQGERSDGGKALLYGDQFRLNLTGDQDGLYSVTYSSTDQGAGLRVTRVALLDQFTRPIVVTSRYKKISDEVKMDIFGEPDSTTSAGKKSSAQRKSRH